MANLRQQFGRIFLFFHWPKQKTLFSNGMFFVWGKMPFIDNSELAAQLDINLPLFNTGLIAIIVGSGFFMSDLSRDYATFSLLCNVFFILGIGYSLAISHNYYLQLSLLALILLPCLRISRTLYKAYRKLFSWILSIVLIIGTLFFFSVIVLLFNYYETFYSTFGFFMRYGTFEDYLKLFF